MPYLQRRLVVLEPNYLVKDTDYTLTSHPEAATIKLPTPIDWRISNALKGYVQKTYPFFYAKGNLMSYLNSQHAYLKGYYFECTVQIYTSNLEALIAAGLKVYAWFKECYFDWGSKNYIILMTPSDKDKWHKVELLPDDAAAMQWPNAAIMTGRKEKFNVMTAEAGYSMVTFRRQTERQWTQLDLDNAPVNVLPIDLFPMTLTYFTVEYNDVNICTPYRAANAAYPSEIYNSTSLVWDADWSKWKLVVADLKNGALANPRYVSRLIPSKLADLVTLSFFDPRSWDIEWVNISDYLDDIFDPGDDEDEQMTKSLMVTISLIFTKILVFDMLYSGTIDWSNWALPLPFWLGFMKMIQGSELFTYELGSGRTSATWGDAIKDITLGLIILFAIFKIAKTAPKIAKKLLARFKAKRKMKKITGAIDKAVELLELQLDLFGDVIDEKTYLLDLLPEMSNMLKAVHDNTVSSQHRAVLSEVLKTMNEWNLTSIPPRPGQVTAVTNQLSTLV